MNQQIAIIIVIALAAVGAVLVPLLKKPAIGKGATMSEEALNQEVARYGAAIKGGTLCERCLTANPPKSQYCAECGTLIRR